MAAKIPEGYHTITPALVVREAAKAIDFYRRAFGAVEAFRLDAPGGKVAHAELQIGDSKFMLGEESPGCATSPQTLGGSPVSLFLYVPDVDASFKQAVDAGAKAEQPPADMFWGDRVAKVTDPFGHTWAMATHVKDVTPEEMKKAAEAMFAETQAHQG
ncbi:MAG TPA: VOC family protein [Bryobacteraceae bacterium]|nr:VOC family protein [Bryobacteraceae bacterium]HOQ45845.1 VOC family protein [Bryobacteraceae bacterium]HPQ13714.1 VOC family protein [Bryobacteraceae bacterium]HPU70946.1 VOC family protein [Bryobacteraceae bacterium]